MAKNLQDFKRFDKQVDELLAKMTLKEKIGQLNQGARATDPKQKERIEEMCRNGEMGSLILAATPTAGNTDEHNVYTEFYNEFQKIAVNESRLGIPLMFGRDVIHGHRTVFPIPLAAACSFNPELITKCYRATAKEATADGIHWTFSPMVDLSRDPRWGRIIEGPGEDPYVGSCFAEAAVKGFQGDDLSKRESMAACAKHYLGYGFSEGGRDYNSTDISGYTLHNCVLPAFRAAVNAGCATVMSSFNDINGVPVAASDYYIKELLHKELGFEGFVVSDWGSIRQMVREGVARDLKDCAELGIKAGVDVDMDLSCYADNLESLVNEGKVDVSYIDEAVRYILRIKFACGLFDDPFRTFVDIDKKPHLALAREIAGESMLLLKNNDSLLPLPKDGKIILAGPFSQERHSLKGSWSGDGEVEWITTMEEALKEVTSENGGSLTLVENSIIYNKAPLAFFKNDGVIVLALGEGSLVSGEANSLASVEITANQVELAREAHSSDKKVVGVIFGGRPLALDPIEPYLDAILYAWHSGTETAHAACDILFGDVNPSGKSSVTFVKTTGHIPLYYNQLHPAKKINAYYGSENVMKSVMGSTGYLDIPSSPMYPFGYGLSYTTFEISNPIAKEIQISLDELKAGKCFEISVKVKNSGSRKGKETVQLYIHDLFASYIRPETELKGFDKIELEAGEEKEVTLTLGYDELGFYDERGKYLLERGDFDVFVGDDCFTQNKTRIRII